MEQEVAKVTKEYEAKAAVALKKARSESLRDQALIKELKKQLHRLGALARKEAEYEKKAVEYKQKDEELTNLKKQIATSRETEAGLKVQVADLERNNTDLIKSQEELKKQLDDASTLHLEERTRLQVEDEERAKIKDTLEKQHAKDLIEISALSISIQQARDQEEKQNRKIMEITTDFQAKEQLTLANLTRLTAERDSLRQQIRGQLLIFLKHEIPSDITLSDSYLITL